MRNSVFLRCFLVCSLAGAMLACGDDSDDDDSGGGGKAGSASAGKGGSGSAGKGGSSGGDVGEDPDELNEECPAATPAPRTGEYALKGDCCYRRSNTARIAAFDADGTGSEYSLEFKSSFFPVANQPNSAGLAPIVESAIDRFDKEEQLLLFRFTLPREDGEWKSGKAKVRIGPGVYNCGTGTYSFYSDTAALDRPYSDDKKRWSSTENPATFDADAAAGKQIKVDWATNTNRQLSYLPYLVPSPDSSGKRGLDWETVSSGFDTLTFPEVTDSLDCVGERDETSWDPGAQAVSFIPLDLNADQPISGSLSNITLSQLLAFGPVGALKDTPGFDPIEDARCIPDGPPGPEGCKWVKLPDSLCPTTDAERKLWGCHVGDEDNADNFATSCTADAPTAALDPDKGATSQGQCCDPLGTSTDLPACNSYRVVNELVASAVEITDDDADALQLPCGEQ